MRRAFFLPLFFPVLFACQPVAERPDTDRESSYSVGTDTALAEKHLQRANTLMESAHFEEALESAKKAEAVFLKLPEGLRASLPGYVEAHKAIGQAHRELGEYDSSLKSYLQALTLASNIWGENDLRVGQIYNRLGGVYYRMWKDSLALEYYGKSKAILKVKLGEEHPEVATLEDNIGGIYILKKDFDKGLPLQKKALRVRAKAPIDTFKLALSYRGISMSFLRMKDSGLALKYADSALHLQKAKFGDLHPEVAKTYHLFGEIYLYKKVYALADSIMGECLRSIGFKGCDSLQLVRDVPFLIYILDTKGRIQRAWHDGGKGISKLLQSRQVYADAIRVLSWQAQKMTANSKFVLAIWANDIYGEALITNYQLYRATGDFRYLKEGFQFSEHSKAFLLYEAIKASKALAFAGVPDVLIRQENDFRREIARNEQLLQIKLASNPSPSDTSIAGAITRLSELDSGFGQLKKKLEREHPKYYQATQDMAAISFEEAQQTLLAPGQALLEYFVGLDSVFIFAIRSDTFRVLSVKKDPSLADWVTEMLAGLQASNTPEGTAKYTKAAHKIYEAVFQPVRDLLAGQSLVIVPDGELNYVPFDALLTAMPAEGQALRHFPFLLREHTLSVSYSATLLREMRQKQHERPPSRRFLGVAPYFPGPSQDLAERKARPGTLPALVENEEEVKKIQEILGGDALAGARATKQAFSETAGKYRVLHLSTHAAANDQAGDYSYLAFCETDGSEENELLFNQELYNLRLNADLVVLSACETGIGELQRGEGVISLARGFSYAGAKSIVTTLWKVRETATVELMRHFYKNLRDGKPKDEALRNAKLYLLDSTAHTSPFFWAAFVPVGDMRPVPPGSGRSQVWLWGVAGAAALILLLWRRRKRRV